MKRIKMKARFTIVAVALVLAFTAMAHAAKQPPTQAVNINTASAAELSTIPGLGAAKSQAIVLYREAAPFKTTEELINVKGIGEKLYAKIAPYVTVSGNLPGTAGMVGNK